MACPLRVAVVGISALLACIGIWLTFFRNRDEDSLVALGDESDSDSDSDSDSEGSEAPKGSSWLGGWLSGAQGDVDGDAHRECTGAAKCDSMSSNAGCKLRGFVDAITGKSFLGRFTRGQLMWIGAAHVVGVRSVVA
jgi:hypothetical protein